MKRRALLSIFIASQMFAWCLAMTPIVARAAECANKWNAPKEVTGTGAKKADAIADFEKKSKTVAKDANCKGNKCAKGNCRAMRTATQSCTGDDEKGWTCTGNVRVGCFCLGWKEKGTIAPKSSTTQKPGDTECSNKFGDPKDAIGASDKGKAQAQTLQDAKIKEYIDAEADSCAKLKCTGEKTACRLYYTTTDPECGESTDPSFPGFACKSQFRAGCFCFGDDEEALAMAVGAAPPAGEEFAVHRPYTGKTMLVGVVLAEGCVPGRTCTASLVANPDLIEGTPGLVVKKVKVPERRNARGHATLQGEVVASNNANRQPADGPITFITPATGVATALTFDVALADQPDEPVSVPVAELPPTHEKHAEQPSAPPVLPDNGVVVVHDKYSGNGHATKVSVNGTDVPVLAESQEMTAFRPVSAVKDGENEYTVTDKGVTRTYKLSAPSIAIKANQTTLEQNQSTGFQVTVSELGGIPDSSWSSTGDSAGEEGYILLTIKNNSSNTTISGGNLIKLPLHKSDFRDGSYTYNGTITAQQPGPFELEAIIDAHLVEAGAINMAGERPNIAKDGNKGCCQYNNPASGNWCIIEDQSECLGTWKGAMTCPQNGTCGNKAKVPGGKELKQSVEPLSENDTTRLLEEKLDEPHGTEEKPPVVIPPIALVPEISLSGRPHDAANDCPQRHDGCLALVINFLKEKPKPMKWKSTKKGFEIDYFPSFLTDPVGDLSELLKGLNCDVDEAVAQFDPVPQPITIGLGRFGNMTIPPVQLLVDAAIANNKRQWGKVDKAILDHREKIQKNHEIALEFIIAHGGDRADWGECGSWGMNFPIGKERSGMRRWPVHLANYWLGRKHLCDWAVFDGSCFSGLTPQAVDELENFSPAGHCDGPETIECPEHAGWESDFATGTAPSTTECMAMNLAFQLGDIRQALQAEKAKYDAAAPGTYDYSSLIELLRKTTNTVVADSNNSKSDLRPIPSYYFDGGYHGDKDGAHHAASGYPQPKVRKKRT
jgi:hypothetical protein